MIKIKDIIKEHNINCIYFQDEWTEEENSEERLLLNNIGSHIKVEKYFDQFLYHPSDVDQSFVSDVFTSFRKYCEKNLVVREMVEPISSFTKDNLINEEQNNLPSLEDLGLNNFEVDSRTAFPFSGGCLSAKDRVNYYLWESKKVNFYMPKYQIIDIESNFEVEDDIEAALDAIANNGLLCLKLTDT